MKITMASKSLRNTSTATRTFIQPVAQLESHGPPHAAGDDSNKYERSVRIVNRENTAPTVLSYSQ